MNSIMIWCVVVKIKNNHGGAVMDNLIVVEKNTRIKHVNHILGEKNKQIPVIF